MCNLVIIRAPWEKNLLLVAKEAGILIYFRAIKDKIRNLVKLDFQYSKGLVYKLISIFILKNVKEILITY